MDSSKVHFYIFANNYTSEIPNPSPQSIRGLLNQVFTEFCVSKIPQRPSTKTENGVGIHKMTQNKSCSVIPYNDTESLYICFFNHRDTGSMTGIDLLCIKSGYQELLCQQYLLMAFGLQINNSTVKT